MYRLKLHLHGAEIQELQLDSGREYTFGRGANCDVQLNEQHGISRTHFRVYEENGQWMAQVVSKFGDILQGGQPVQQIALEPGTVFQLAGYSFQFLEQAKQEAASQVSHLPATLEQNEEAGYASPQRFGDQMNAPIAVGGGIAPSSDSDFDGNDEVTRVIAHEPEVPFLRIVDGDGTEETIKLDGRRWIAGREEGCSILLNDRKASRRQFELSSTPQGYFIRDLGSSNGTLLNGMALASDELKPIRSGDVIQIGAVVLHFEIRDPNFDKKLMVVPTQIRSDFPIVVQNPYEMINFPVPTGPGGAVRVDAGGANGAGGLMARIEQVPIPWTEHLDAQKKKKVRFWIMVAIVLLPLIFFLSAGEDSKPKKADPKRNQAYEKLSPKQQQQVKETYVLAMNLYMQQKLALAADQLKKLHEVIPEGYENSLAMAAEAAEQAKLEAQLRELEQEKRRQEEVTRTIERTIQVCDPIANRTYSIDELNACLRPALDLDPGNAKVQSLQARVQERVRAKEINDANRRDFQASVAKGKAMYMKAQALENAGDFLEARAAYEKHAQSRYPDPENLKAVSQRNILTITKRISSQIDESLRAAESAYSVSNYKEALNHIIAAKKIDPSNERAAELNAKYRRELNVKLKEIYEEAVISEGLGMIDEAKARWKKILEMDHPEGEYYKKARNKLKTYGAL